MRAADAALYRAKARGRNGWFGLLRADAGAEATLLARAAGPLDAWMASGELATAASPTRDPAGAPGRA